MIFKSLIDFTEQKPKFKPKPSKPIAKITLKQAISSSKSRVTNPKLMTFILSAELMNEARIESGDYISVLCSEDHSTWQIKVEKEAEKRSGVYKLCPASKVTKNCSHRVRITWIEKMPNITGDDNKFSATAYSKDDEVKIGVGEVTFTFNPPIIESQCEMEFASDYQTISD